MQTSASPSARTDAISRPAPIPMAPPSAGHTLALRLCAPVDADLLHDQLRRWWQPASCRRRGVPAVVLSVVESCARSRQERERDALRLLGLEAEAGPRRDPRDALRATLVSLDATEHLLLLAVDPGASAAAGLPALSSALAAKYPVESVG